MSFDVVSELICVVLMERNHMVHSQYYVGNTLIILLHIHTH